MNATLKAKLAANKAKNDATAAAAWATYDINNIVFKTDPVKPAKVYAPYIAPISPARAAQIEETKARAAKHTPGAIAHEDETTEDTLNRWAYIDMQYV